MSPSSIRTDNSAQCIRSAIDLEVQAGLLYLQLAARFADQPWWSSLLRGLADEEAEHASRIRLLERLQGGRLAPPEKLGRIAGDLRRAHDRITSFQRHFAETRPVPATEVLDAAGEVEMAFQAVHAEIVAATLLPEARDLFRSLAKHDAHHETVLARARERLAREEAARPPVAAAGGACSR